MRQLAPVAALALLAAPGAAEETIRLDGHTGSIVGVAFTPGGDLVSCGRDGLRVWDVGARKLKVHHPVERVASMSVSADGKLAAVGRRQEVLVLDLASGKLTQTLAGHGARVARVAFAPDGRSLASADADGVVRLWGLPGGAAGHVLKGHAANVLALAWRPDGGELASGDSDGVIHFWDPARGAAKDHFKAHDWFIGGLAWAPDGKRFATASKTWSTKVFERPERELFEWKGGTKLYAVAYSPDGKRLASGGRKGWVQLLDPTTGQPTQRLDAKYDDENEGLVDLAWSRDGRWVAAAHFDGHVRVWKVD